MIRFYNLILILCLGVACNFAQKIATIEVELSREANDFDIPVSVNLDDITILSDSSLNLLEINGNKKIAVPFQIDKGTSRTINWLVKPEDAKQKKVVYELVNEIPVIEWEQIWAKKIDGALVIQTKGKNLLSYYFKTLYPPEGVDTAYKRSGFIHPLWSPRGQVLTRIQPPDHYHHYGIWNPWTRALFEKDTIDFWNLRDRKGTVRFANFVSITSGTVFSEYKTVHEHVVFKKDGSEKVALNELQSIKVYRPEANQDYYLVDIEIDLNCATESPVLLLKYRYGGLGWRTTQQWDRYNSEVLTSEGKTRKDADDSKGRWCLVQGEVDNDYAGVVMMSYPTNYNHPEPLRIWPENQYDRGDIFANFDPTKDKDWLLEPGKKYVLKYRFLVFNNHFSNEQAESAYQYFANTPNVVIHSKN